MSGCKLVALVRKRADLSRDDFIAYYEAHHAPLILSLFPTITQYRRNFADFEGAFAFPNAAPFDFDCVTEIGFADRAGYEDMRARTSQPEVMARISKDEQNFLDQSFTRMFLVDERCSQIAKETPE